MKNKTIKTIIALCLLAICIASCKKHCEAKPCHKHINTDTTATVG